MPNASGRLWRSQPFGGYFHRTATFRCQYSRRLPTLVLISVILSQMHIATHVFRYRCLLDAYTQFTPHTESSSQPTALVLTSFRAIHFAAKSSRRTGIELLDDDLGGECISLPFRLRCRAYAGSMLMMLGWRRLAQGLRGRGRLLIATVYFYIPSHDLRRLADCRTICVYEASISREHYRPTAWHGARAFHRCKYFDSGRR